MAVNHKIFDLAHELIGLELIQIQKKNSQVELTFRNRKDNKKTILSFKGMLFETPFSVLNKKVQNVLLNQNLGFKAITQLRLQNIDVSAYEEVLVQMQGNTPDFKIELLCVSDDFKLKHVRSISKNTLATKE